MVNDGEGGEKWGRNTSRLNTRGWVIRICKWRVGSSALFNLAAGCSSREKMAALVYGLQLRVDVVPLRR